MTRKLLEFAGIGRDRLHLAWVSSAEAQRFVEVVNQVTRSVRDQGKFEPQNHKLQLEAAEKTLATETIRWIVGKQVQLTTKGDVYGRPWDKETLEKIIDTTLEREYHKNLILEAVKDGCPSPREIREKIGLDLKRISYLLADMEKTSMIAFKGMQECKPIFAAL